MIHHSYRDLLHRHSLKNIQSNKKNVQDILWKPAGNKKKRQQHIK
jgi:hypothetical protein